MPSEIDKAREDYREAEEQFQQAWKQMQHWTAETSRYHQIAGDAARHLMELERENKPSAKPVEKL